jgi:hypothetical protein
MIGEELREYFVGGRLKSHNLTSRYLKLLNIIRKGNFRCFGAELLKEILLNQDLGVCSVKCVRGPLLLRVLSAIYTVIFPFSSSLSLFQALCRLKFEVLFRRSVTDSFFIWFRL